MKLERDLHLPPKAMLTWRISRLTLNPASAWIATAYKGSRVSVITLPPLEDPAQERSWLAELEALFEANAFDPTQDPYVGLRS